MVGKKKEKTDKVIRRSDPKEIGIFIDGISVDRATKRIGKKMAWDKIVSSLSHGLAARVTRYYTVLPLDDDARQHSFLDAVSRAGISVVVKRLPPKGIDRQVTSDTEMASDIIAFGLGATSLVATGSDSIAENSNESPVIEGARRKIFILCPSREMIYPLRFLQLQGIETVIADFGIPPSPEIMKAASNWIDLSTSETIWLD